MHSLSCVNTIMLDVGKKDISKNMILTNLDEKNHTSSLIYINVIDQI